MCDITLPSFPTDTFQVGCDKLPAKRPGRLMPSRDSLATYGLCWP